LEGAKTSSGERGSLGHVAALDGLRAVAVTLVLLFHLRIRAFGAGFVGVDVFFVISGFLITSLLLAESSKTGRISLPDFWARRARRLLPALLLVLVAIAVVTAIHATPIEKPAIRGDLLATTFYSANWRFIATGSYFNNIGVESPLQHTWSLAVEEQFYLLWPIVLVVGLSFARSLRRVVLAIAIPATILSIILLARWWQPGAVDRAYMGTDSKIFEPLVGALGAAIMTIGVVRRSVTRWGPLLAVLGALGIAFAVATIDPTASGYFRGSAVLLCVATLLLIVAVWVGAAGILGTALAWAPIAWIGAISYGMYLWHWPLAIWLGVRDPTASHPYVRRSVVAIATVAIAATSYHLIESPIRRAASGGTDRANARRRRRLTLAAVPVALVAMAAVSVSATTVPPITSKSRVLMLVGDSVPKRLEVELDRAFEAKGWRVVSAAFGGCPVSGEPSIGSNGEVMPLTEECTGEVAETQDDLIRTTTPDIVLWWDRFSIAGFQTPEGQLVPGGSAEFWELRRIGLQRTVQRLETDGAVVVLEATEPPGQAILTTCGGGRCGWLQYQVDHYEDITIPWNTTMRRYADGTGGRVAFIDVSSAVCRELVARCDDSVNGTPARPDGVHYVGAGADVVVDALMQRLGPIMSRFG
jgi:peptidoglycan/LPS O-acetylase OafA/YrhL